MSIFSDRGLHAQVPSVILTVISVGSIGVTASEERVQEVTCEGLRTYLIIASIHVYWLLEAEGVDTLQALPLVLYLFWVGVVRQGHSTIIELCTALLLLSRPQLMEVGHCVGLRHLVLRKLVQIRLYKRAVLTAVPLRSLVVEPGRHRSFLFG